MELLTLDLRGALGKQAFFGAAAERAQDLTPVWNFVHNVWLHEIAQQFLSEGRFVSDGEEWAPLNPEYARWKARHLPPPAPLGILYRTGRLLEALSNEGSAEHVFSSTPDSVLLGATTPYGKYHQTGTDHMPVRPIIRTRNRFRRTVIRAAVRHILSGDIDSIEPADIQAPPEPGESA